MLPSFGVGYGQVLQNNQPVADVLYDIRHERLVGASLPLVHVDLYTRDGLRDGQLCTLVNRPDVTLALMDGSRYPIRIYAEVMDGCFPSQVITTTYLPAMHSSLRWHQPAVA